MKIKLCLFAGLISLLVPCAAFAQGAHRYWRVNVTQTYTSGNQVSCAELELHSVIGGPNVATGGTPIASSNDGDTPDRCFDGNPSTYWASATSTLPQWIGYDWGSGNTAGPIVEIKWTARNCCQAQEPIAFDVDYSDNGSIWTATWYYNNPALTWTASQSITFTLSVTQGFVQVGIGPIGTIYSVPAGTLLVYTCKSESSISSLSLTDSGTGASFAEALIDSGHANNVAIYYGTTASMGLPNVSVTGCPNNYTLTSLASFAESGTPAVEETNSCYNGASPSTCSITTTSASAIFSAQAGFHSNNIWSANYPTTLLAQANGSDALAVGYQGARAGSNTASYNFTQGGTDNAPLELVAFTNVELPWTAGIAVSKANVYAVIQSSAPPPPTKIRHSATIQ